MEAQQKSPFGFAQSRLPRIIAAGALVLYVLTLNHWVRVESLSTLARVTGAEWATTMYAPLHFLVTCPFRLLPAAWQPVGLNLLSAVLAALTLALLARSVSLLPYDRTSDTRWLERSEFSLLTHPPAWLPAAVAVLLCGLQITFWEHATAATGEMLDLLLFAYVIRCLLEYRIGRDDAWLYKLAFAYGLAVTNNYAMIAFFPCCLIVLVWIMEASFFRKAFLVRMLGAGVAGLLLYLVLPVVSAWSGDGIASFWSNLRTVLGNQKGLLLALRPYVYVILLLSFTSLLPLFIVGIRWSGGLGDQSPAGAALATMILRVVYAALLIACVSIFFDAVFGVTVKWSPRGLGLGLPSLPLYYTAALSTGYFVGYFLLVFGTQAPKPGQRSADAPPPTLGFAGILLMIGAAVCAAMLVLSNLPAILFSNGKAMGQLADLMLQPLPSRPAYLVADTPAELLLSQTRLRQAGSRVPHMLVNTAFLPYTAYHDQLTKQYGPRWPSLHAPQSGQGLIATSVLTAWFTGLAQSNEVYYLNPSFGYYLESVQLRPRGMVFQVRPLPTNAIMLPLLTPAELAENQKFWEAAEPVLNHVPVLTNRIDPDWRVLAQLYSRALNSWGVTLQRHDQAAAAAKWFELAVRLRPENLAAKANLAFNRQLRQGLAQEIDLSQPLDPTATSQISFDQILATCGPVDDPAYLYRFGQGFAQAGLYRQALAAFDRLHRLFPANATADLWRQNMEIMTRLSLGDVPAAESQALALHQRLPREDTVLETLTQIYLLTARFSNALATVDQQIALKSSHQRALLNKAAILIQLKHYPEAIPVLDKLLTLVPDSNAALMNRAIAHLQSGNLDKAQRDYEALRKAMPDYYPVFYGLGEIAYRRKDKTAALANYDLYLEYGRKGTEEYKAVSERVKELRAGASR